MKKCTIILLTFFALLSIACLGAYSGNTNQQGDPIVEREGEPDIIRVGSQDDEMNAAIQQAQDTLDTFIEHLLSPQPNQVYFSIKARFHYGQTDDTNYEHMWLDDITYEAGAFVGTLTNEPTDVENLKAGDTVSVERSDVTDWIIVEENGKFIGGFTIYVLRDRMSPEEQEAFDRETGLIFED